VSVRKRTWTTPKGETKEAWVVNYRDKARGGSRVQRTFHLKKEADAFVVDMKGEVRDGIHIARSKSVTVAQAGKEWIKTAELNVERATVANYQAVLTFHIVPFIGHEKLPDLTVPLVRAFEDKLREEGRSAAMVKRARSFLSMLLSDAMERGLATRNVARGLSSNRKRGKERQAERRAKGQTQGRGGYPDPRRGPCHHDERQRALAAGDPDGAVLRAAVVRTARAALGERGPG